VTKNPSTRASVRTLSCVIAISGVLALLYVFANHPPTSGAMAASAMRVGAPVTEHPPTSAHGPSKPAARAPAPPGGATRLAAQTQTAPANPPTQLSVDSAHLSLVQFNLNGTIGANGAMGMNLIDNGWYSLGEQRPFEHLLHAAVTSNTVEMASVLTSFEYTYNHQNADGSWPILNIPGSPYSPGGGFVGTAFFYADLGRSLGLLADSTWFQTSPATATLRGRLNALRPRIALGLNWLGTSPSHISIFAMGVGDTNRGAAAAEAFLLVGEWVNNGADIATGEKLLQHAEANQLPDGTILENGGFDPGYQVVSLNHLWDIYFHVSGNLLSLRAGVWNELQRGLAKEQTVVSVSGQVDYSDGTRTGCGGGTYQGEPKQGGGDDLARALVYAAATTGKNELLAEASAVISYYKAHSASHCP
jgi:hypothetical protein